MIFLHFFVFPLLVFILFMVAYIFIAYPIRKCDCIIKECRAKEGDVVRIKTGDGPMMTVGCRIGDAHWCSWWDNEKKKFKTEMFYLSQLEVVEKNNGDDQVSTE